MIRQNVERRENMASRANSNLFWYLKNYGIKYVVKSRIWREPYFIQDSFKTPFNRLIGCKVFGHKKGETYNDSNEKIPFCWKCYREIDNTK